VWPRGWVEVYLYTSMTAALEGGEWSAARPARTLPREKTPYPEAGWVPRPIPPVTICATTFNITQFYVLPTQCVCELLMVLRKKSEQFSIYRVNRPVL